MVQNDHRSEPIRVRELERLAEEEKLRKEKAERKKRREERLKNMAVANSGMVSVP